jgi:hypothetical protein
MHTSKKLGSLSCLKQININSTHQKNKVVQRFHYYLVSKNRKAIPLLNLNLAKTNLKQNSINEKLLTFLNEFFKFEA